jgi:hypothetical protein
MRFAVSLGVFSKSGKSLPTLLSEMAEVGFDAMSLDPQLILQLNSDQQRDILACLNEHTLQMALHTQFSVPLKEIRAVADLLGSHLANITFDSELRWTSAGFIFDMKRIVPYFEVG